MSSLDSGVSSPDRTKITFLILRNLQVTGQLHLFQKKEISIVSFFRKLAKQLTLKPEVRECFTVHYRCYLHSPGHLSTRSRPRSAATTPSSPHRARPSSVWEIHCNTEYPCQETDLLYVGWASVLISLGQPRNQIRPISHVVFSRI